MSQFNMRMPLYAKVYDFVMPLDVPLADDEPFPHVIKQVDELFLPCKNRSFAAAKLIDGTISISFELEPQASSD